MKKSTDALPINQDVTQNMFFVMENGIKDFINIKKISDEEFKKHFINHYKSSLQQSLS